MDPYVAKTLTVGRSLVRALLVSGLFAACRPTTEASAVPDAGARGLEAAPSIAASGAPAPSIKPGPVVDGAGCARDADCGGGLVCFFVNAGCDPASRVGECRGPDFSHECAANVPMCSCDGRTLWGKPCLGLIHERWSHPQRCACHADGDCKGGQKCFFTSAGCGAAGQCDDPAMVKCAAPTATFCTCKKQTLSHTCAQTMREPWSKASACD